MECPGLLALGFLRYRTPEASFVEPFTISRNELAIASFIIRYLDWQAQRQTARSIVRDGEHWLKWRAKQWRSLDPSAFIGTNPTDD